MPAFHQTCVLPETGSMWTRETKRRSAGPVAIGLPEEEVAMNRSASPTLMLLAEPVIQVVVSPGLSCQGISVCAGRALSAMTAVRSEEVSKTWGVWPGPNALDTSAGSDEDVVGRASGG